MLVLLDPTYGLDVQYMVHIQLHLKQGATREVAVANQETDTDARLVMGLAPMRLVPHFCVADLMVMLETS